MNIESTLLEDHSKAQVEAIVTHIGDSSEFFAELMDLFLNGSPPIPQRAAWVMSHCADKSPALISPYIEAMVENLKQPQPVHDAVKRNTVRAWQNVKIPVSLQGEVADLCFQFLGSSQEPVAIKAFSMTILFNIVLDQPELKHELRIMIEDQLPYGSAGFVSRGNKILKKLSKLYERL